MCKSILHGRYGFIKRISSAMVIIFELGVIALTGVIVLPFMLLLWRKLEMMVAQVSERTCTCATMERRAVERTRGATGVQRRGAVRKAELLLVIAAGHGRVWVRGKEGRAA
jgi:hypothetical protein